MKRRDFVFQSGLAAAALTPGIWSGNRLLAMSESPLCGWKIQWRQDTATKLYLAATCDERPLAVADESGLLVAFCRLASETPGQSTWLDAKRPGGEHGPLRIELRHELRNSGSNNGRDLLEAVLTLENRSAKPQTVIVGCATSIQPTPDWSKQNLHLPLAASIGFDVMGEIASAPHKEAQWRLGNKDFVAHYLEPQASDPAVRKPLARLLVPLVDVYHPGVKHRVSLMAGPDRARRFATHKDPNGCRGWTAQTVFTLAPGQKLEDRCYLLIHGGDADKAWDVFHRVAHRDAWPAIDWLAAVKAHYYDFLSASDPEGHRGDGYDAAVPHFREFRVGLATQHGYYPGYGDYIHPDRPRWLAMQNDKHGPVEMSFDKIRGRIEATRQTGAKAAIYMHLVGLDDSSKKFFPKLSDARLVGRDGQPIKYYWSGCDVPGNLWQMSMAAPEWRDHLLQQARWIMEILKPDAIVIDETFAGLGYDEHPRRRGPLSAHAIDFFKKMRTLVLSFGQDRALLTSDCGMSGFALWADGEAGDHAYPPLLGDPAYRREPVCYRAVLGQKPWIPCAWNYTKFWEAQMDLARKASAGVGLTNGWIEYTGLHRLPPEVRTKMIADIATLFPGKTITGPN